MPLPDSMQGHGTFVHSAAETIAAYGSVREVVRAMKRCHMTHAWVRVHGRRVGHADESATRELVKELRAKQIAVAGWGWCQGDDAEAEAALAIENLQALDIHDYVADIEEGVNRSHWTAHEVELFLSHVRERIGGALAVSSFGLITWHEPELMKAAEPYVDAFAPQTYWFDFPSPRMQRQFGTKYPLHDPASYVHLCIDRWRRLTFKPLVITGQAYWGEGIDQEQSEKKLAAFLAGFADWDRIAALNWWHFGGRHGMSETMRHTIAAARVDQRFGT